MAEENPKKSSLKGRGRDIMRGPQDEEDKTNEEGKPGGWLPPVQSTPDAEGEEPYFEDEEALLRWMEADPEEHSPTTTASESPEEEEAVPDDALAEPDFDAIFGEESSQQPQAEKTDSQTLEDIFVEEETHFDDLFGDVAGTASAQGEDEALPDDTTMDMPVGIPDYKPLPEDSGQISDEEVFADQEQPYEEPEPEEGIPAAELRSVGTGPMPASPEEGEEDFDSFEMDDVFAEEFLEDVEEDVPPPSEGIPQADLRDVDTGPQLEGRAAEPPAEAPVPEEDWFADDLFGDEGVPGFSQSHQTEEEPQEGIPQAEARTFNMDDSPIMELPKGAEALDDLEEEDYALPALESEDIGTIDDEEVYHTPEVEPPPFDEAEMGEATSILQERFDEEDSAERSFGEQATLNLLDEMTGDIEEEEFVRASEEDDWTSVVEPEQRWRQRAEEDEVSEAEAFVAMLEDEALDAPDEESLQDSAAEDALDAPFSLRGDIDAETQDTGQPFGLQESEASLPAVERGIRDKESLPPVEAHTQAPVDVRMERFSRGAIDSLDPPEPEVLSPGELPPDMYVLEDEEPEDFGGQEFESVMDSAGGSEEQLQQEDSTRRSGPLLLDADDIPEPKPFGEIQPRISAKQIFQQPEDIRADSDLLDMLVDDNRIRELFEQIEGMQEEIVKNVRGERGNTDTYQEELLRASNMVLSSRENYDEARAIVYRIRADINREKRVENDIKRWRPIIFNIYIGLGIFLVVLALLGQLFISLTESVDAAWIGQGYYPALAGMAGALYFGYRTLNKHTTIQRDFDPIHLNWYIANPFLGILSGFLVYLFLWGMAELSFSTETAEITGLSPLTLIFAAFAGFNQNVVTSIFESVRGRYSDDDGDNTRPPAVPSNS